MDYSSTRNRFAAAIIGLLLLAMLGSKIFFFVFNSMWAAGDGNGNLMGAMRHRWQAEGGLKGFFRLTSDLNLAASPETIVSEAAASRLLTQRQCDKEEGMLALLRTKPHSPMVRVRLMQALAACGSRKVIPDIRDALRENDPMISSEAALSAMMLRAREAIPELEKAVSTCAPYCAGAAASALSHMGEGRVAYPWAVQVLSAERPTKDFRSEDSYKRMFAGQVMQNIGTAKDIPLIEKNSRSLGVFAEDHKKAMLNRGER